MNERLKQIMLGSGTHKYISAECQHRVELVAELIVAECLQYLQDEAERLYMLEDGDADMLAEKCYDNIQGLKDHFGVEP